MMQAKVLITIITISAVGLMLLIGSIISNQQDDERYRRTFTGVGFNPSTNGNFIQDLERANEVGLVFFNAPYDGGIPEIIQVGFETGHIDLPVPNMAGDAKDIPGLTAAYIELVEKYEPVFVGLGNEIELMSDKDDFIDAYNGMYAKIKESCPDCIVYPVFQYENFEPELAEFMTLDLLAFTTYPFAQYQNIADIPDDYYDKAFLKAEEKGVNVAFTEIGWTHLPDYIRGYDSVDQAQAAFYGRIKELIHEQPVQFISWGLLYGSPETGEEWADLGLYRIDGTSKSELINKILKDK